MCIQNATRKQFLESSLFQLNSNLFSLLASAIDAPGGFLFEWWSVFWDIFIARTNEKHSEVAASYIEVCYKSEIKSYNFQLMAVLEEYPRNIIVLII